MTLMHMYIMLISYKMYDTFSKISDTTFLTLFSNKMLVIKAGIHRMLVIIANREDPNQAASSEAV